MHLRKCGLSKKKCGIGGIGRGFPQSPRRAYEARPSLVSLAASSRAESSSTSSGFSRAGGDPGYRAPRKRVQVQLRATMTRATFTAHARRHSSGRAASAAHRRALKESAFCQGKRAGGGRLGGGFCYEASPVKTDADELDSYARSLGYARADVRRDCDRRRDDDDDDDDDDAAQYPFFRDRRPVSLPRCKRAFRDEDCDDQSSLFAAPACAPLPAETAPTPPPHRAQPSEDRSPARRHVISSAATTPAKTTRWDEDEPPLPPFASGAAERAISRAVDRRLKVLRQHLADENTDNVNDDYDSPSKPTQALAVCLVMYFYSRERERSARALERDSLARALERERTTRKYNLNTHSLSSFEQSECAYARAAPRLRLASPLLSAPSPPSEKRRHMNAPNSGASPRTWKRPCEAVVVRQDHARHVQRLADVLSRFDDGCLGRHKTAKAARLVPDAPEASGPAPASAAAVALSRYESDTQKNDKNQQRAQTRASPF